jgi:ketosteroid isomerase-like protein
MYKILVTETLIISQMTKPSFMKLFIATTLLLFTGLTSNAQEAQRHFDKQLYDTIFKVDSACFAAFNKQDLEGLKKYFAKDVEFYNDNGTITDYEETMKGFANMFKQAKISGLKRELVKSSLEVYALKGFGAIEVGVHKFTHIENGKEEVGLLKFTEVWQNKDGEWKMTRVISYNH